MRRRKFITLPGGAAAAWPLAARAQQSERMRRVGVLMTRVADDPQSRLQVAAFQQRLQELGWTNDVSIRIEYRWGAGEAGQYRKYAAELVGPASDGISHILVRLVIVEQYDARMAVRAARPWFKPDCFILHCSSRTRIG